MISYKYPTGEEEKSFPLKETEIKLFSSDFFAILSS